MPDRTRSLADGAVEPWSHPSGRWYQKQLLKAAKKRGVDVTRPVRRAPRGGPAVGLRRRRRAHRHPGLLRGGRGVPLQAPRARLPLALPQPVAVPALRGAAAAPGGARRPRGRAPASPSSATRPWRSSTRSSTTLPLTGWEDGGGPRRPASYLRAKLRFLLRVGLGYLTLGRQTRTLSGGEAQRINLANQLGAQLVGTLYVLDEPSIGLHARDTARLAELCRELAAGRQHRGHRRARPLADRGGRLRHRDGPGLGRARRRRWCSRAPRRSFSPGPALAHRALSERPRDIPLPLARREGRRALVITGARAHNLKDVIVRIPLHTLTCVTGVSGSGKSTLVHDTLYRAAGAPLQGRLRRCRARTTRSRARATSSGVRLIDQEPIGRTPRSNPVTYVKAFDEIRKLFAGLPRAKALGLGPGRLLVQRAGRALRDLPGRRRAEARDVLRRGRVRDAARSARDGATAPTCSRSTYKGANISEVLQADDGRGRRLLRRPSRARAPAQGAPGGGARLPAAGPARDDAVGRRGAAAQDRRGAVRRGSPPISSTSSTSRPRACTWTTSRSSSRVLNRLVDAGNTVLVVEHHLDVIKTADWVIDLGPEAGAGGRRARGRGHARADRAGRRVLHGQVPPRSAAPRQRQRRRARAGRGPLMALAGARTCPRADRCSTAGWSSAASFAILFMAYGSQFSFGVFLSALLEDSAGAGPALSGAFSLYAFVYTRLRLRRGRGSPIAGGRARSSRWAASFSARAGSR